MPRSGPARRPRGIGQQGGRRRATVRRHPHDLAKRWTAAGSKPGSDGSLSTSMQRACLMWARETRRCRLGASRPTSARVRREVMVDCRRDLPSSELVRPAHPASPVTEPP
jgi:hypothetical protein